ncbi:MULTISPECIES: 2Fe-2S iron-sulfur cluster binding domain-containing protein [unclassified Polaromonas]|uniref:2Fe-2S iron-sulfur cluster-binding protein n=1 Tax=unclassified Polaromonas TaxID=2638319 RepID=UPI0018C91976|nr:MULTISPECIES: 2Fe-2S iron-sulfur cluster binding domain-containing protein [unclassified Polaromonas]MBG6071556.1 ferredoxin [Polaromonas sp. CG_9.7]MBG6113557.1 ferredoxin [Polaromonas sp. CG_9.2]MDH6184545.1 ferredoxin [Polaromonas sp. CG_23.6]
MPDPQPKSPTTLEESSSQIFNACIAGDATVFEVSAALPLLVAAEHAGVWLRDSSCRNGTCRTCICRLVSGQVVYRIDWPGLSLDEKREGFILPCVAYPASDVVIEALF